MLGGLFKKLLAKKSVSKKAPLTSRDLDGRNHVGYPTMQLSNEIDDVVHKYYRSIKPMIKFYKETLFFKWGPGVINAKLSDEQLANLSGRDVQMAYLLVFRDMLRHLSIYITPKNAPENWANLLAQEVLDNCQMFGDQDDTNVAAKQALFANLALCDVTTEQVDPWINPIAELIYLPAEDFYQCHRSLLATLLKKVNKNKK